MNTEHEDIVATLADKVITLDIAKFRNDSLSTISEMFETAYPEYYNSIDGNITVDELYEYCEANGWTGFLRHAFEQYQKHCIMEDRLMFYSILSDMNIDKCRDITKVKIIFE